MASWKYEVSGDLFEDSDVLKTISHAFDMQTKIMDALSLIRNRMKYEDIEEDSAEYRLLEELRSILFLEWEY